MRFQHIDFEFLSLNPTLQDICLPMAQVGVYLNVSIWPGAFTLALFGAHSFGNGENAYCS